MSLNVTKIQQQVRRAISLRPTNITLKRNMSISDGMGGYILGPDTPVATFDIFLDDSKHSTLVDKLSDSGSVRKTRQLTLLAICEDFEILDLDTFEVNGRKYQVTYASQIVDKVFNCDLEVIS